MCVYISIRTYLCMYLCTHKQWRIRARSPRTLEMLTLEARKGRHEDRRVNKGRRKGEKSAPLLVCARRGLRPLPLPTAPSTSHKVPSLPCPSLISPSPFSPSPRWFVLLPTAPFSSSDGVYIDLVPLASSHAVSTFGRFRLLLFSLSLGSSRG